MADQGGTTGHRRTLATAFAKQAILSADRIALTCDGVSWRYDFMQRRIARLAASLHHHGVRKGDRVGYLGFNDPDTVILLLASASLGAVFVPLNYRLTATELRFLIDDAGIHALFVGTEHIDIVVSLGDLLPCKLFVQVGGQHPKWPSMQDFIATDLAPATAPSVDISDVAAIFYTSGTTGRPKGAMLTHANLWANNLNWILSYGIAAGDVLLTTAPMFHVSGLFVLLSAVLMVGGQVILHRSFDAGAVTAAIEGQRVTMTFAVPTMILAITQCVGFETADFSSLRFVIVGGAPTPESLLRRCAARAIPISHTYGMTEVTSASTFLETRHAIDKVNSVGRAMVLSEFSLIDGDGRPLIEPFAKGELMIRGENVIAGYWNRPDANAASFVAGGWFRTGDVGYVDADGFLYVCDRVGDMIISGGENIYPAEVESVLLEHTAVANAAVVGAPDDYWGERVVAVVVLKRGMTLTCEELVSFCRPLLAGYKIPRDLHILDELPLNGAGKIDGDGHLPFSRVHHDLLEWQVAQGNAGFQYRTLPEDASARA